VGFQIGDWVVCPAFGVGRIVGLAAKSLLADESRLYFEITGEVGTVWVQADQSAAGGLRHLTHQSELGHFRQVLRGRPAVLNSDFRQRRLDVREQMRRGTLQALCEVVRDLRGRAWVKPLGENDAHALQKSSDALYREWAAADRVSLEQATTEVNGLLLEGRHAHEG
jgi:RNA polymerase-interacting CarD/CdnL/TRCF family regulator